MAKCYMYSKKTEDNSGFNIVVSSSQPTNPKENTIWVKNALKQYIISSTEPTDPVQGLIWLRASESGILISAKIYINTLWTKIDASLYACGEWRQFSWEKRYLIKDGKLLVDFITTDSYFYQSGNWYPGQSPKVSTSTEDYYTISLTQDGSNHGGMLVSNNKISLTDYDNLCTTVIREGLGYARMGLITSKSQSHTVDKSLALVDMSTKMHELSIKEFDENTLYIGFDIIAVYGTTTVKIKDLWLE